MVSEDVKQRLSVVIEVGKTIFHYGYIPVILYLGFKKGADPGMPDIVPSSIIW